MSYKTTQKQAIYDWVKNSESHPTAQDVFEGVRKQLPNISFATVYRNLDAMSKAGKLCEVQFIDKVKRYEAHLKPHQHFVCEKCHRIIDMELSKLLNVDEVSDMLQCHTVHDYKLELIGLCASCK